MMSCCNLHPLVLDYLLKLKPCIKNEKFLEKSVDLKYTLSLGLKNIENYQILISYYHILKFPYEIL